MNPNKQVDLLDSTLRDGAQGEGISFSVEDKLNIVTLLDELGIGFIEAGNPGSNPKDLTFFNKASKLSLKTARLVAFGSTRRKGLRASEDSNIKDLLNAGTTYVSLFGKSWDLHVTRVIHTTLEENLRMIEETVRYLTEQGRKVLFDAEHFFDGYKENPSYALDALEAAARGGAVSLVLCDTNGGSFPHEIEAITKAAAERFPGRQLGIHAHNDGGMAVANSIAAVQSGARHVQGTYLGFGERTGNANLSAVLPNLQLKLGYACIPEEKMAALTSVARSIAEIANISLRKNEPYIGSSAFAHKAGMHADGVLKASRSFEHISPGAVGNERRFLMSEMAGRTAVLEKIRNVCPELEKDSPETMAVLDALKEMEHQGYQFEGAESSFELLIRKVTGSYRPYFELIDYKIVSNQPCEENCSSTATVKIRVENKVQLMAAEGNGPVNALDRALRSALEVFYPTLTKMHLTDYKVRVMDSRATAATVRVLITSTDGKRIWSTVGVSSDIIQASWIALVDSIEYKLSKDRDDEQPEDGSREALTANPD